MPFEGTLFFDMAVESSLGVIKPAGAEGGAALVFFFVTAGEALAGRAGELLALNMEASTCIDIHR